MALPAATDFTGPGITQAQFKGAITDLRTFLATLMGTTGDVATALDTLSTLFAAGVTAKSGAYTVATADRGQLFDCTGTLILTLPAAASAGAGFAFAVRNSGSGAITIDPNAAELINGTTAFTLTAGAALIVVCTGTAWVVVGHPGELNYVKNDHGHNQIGSLCLAGRYATNGQVFCTPGNTVSGSSIQAASCGDTVFYSGGALSGTWRCLGFLGNYDASFSYNIATLFQRIA